MCNISAAPRWAPYPQFHVCKGTVLLAQAIQAAARRLREPECRRVLSDFTDISGNLLEANLIRLSLDPSRHLLNAVWFEDASDQAQCRGKIAAFTQPGSRVIFVCGKYFDKNSHVGGGRNHHHP